MAPVHVGRYALLILAALGMGLVGCAQPGGNRDALQEIVSQCLDVSVADYCQRCRWPQREAKCGNMGECRGSTEVWAVSENYVAIRDIKMCGCPSQFVHGIVLPRTRVSGVEDPRRPDGIWQFAWDAARQRIPSADIALAVNPRGLRSQDQLHVHLVRLNPAARSALADQVVLRVSHFEEIWPAAALAARAQGLQDYGVLVVADTNTALEVKAALLVVVVKDSPEKLFTRWHCD